MAEDIFEETAPFVAMEDFRSVRLIHERVPAVTIIIRRRSNEGMRRRAMP
jgi:hypothetical protein